MKVQDGYSSVHPFIYSFTQSLNKIHREPNMLYAQAVHPWLRIQLRIGTDFVLKITSLV